MSRQVEAPESEEASPRVLLVDDDAETLALLQAFLENEGIRVVGTAGDGSEVLEQADRLRPDVVLMDLRMPRVDGFTATRLIKEHHPSIQVIILTFHDEMLSLRDPEDVGAFAYLVKGAPPRQIGETIRRAWTQASEARAKPTGSTRSGSSRPHSQPVKMP